MTKYDIKKHFLWGLRDAVPVILGFIPVGIAFAIMARQAGFTVLRTCIMSLTVFAGASQMMAVGMYEQGASIIAMIIATFILNLRHIIMGTCIANRMDLKSSSLIMKLISFFGVTDEGFAIFTTAKKEKCTVWYLFGLTVVMYSSWNIGTFIGAVASDLLPTIITASLGISLYAMFIGLLVPNLKGNLRLFVLAVITAVCNCILNMFMAPSWALVVSTLVCAFIGVFFVDIKDESEDMADE